MAPVPSSAARKNRTRGAEQLAQGVARKANPWIEPLGRAGFAAKGLVYGLVGVLALMAAFGLGGETTDAQGALEWITRAPFGRALLAAVAVGLFGYAVWRFVQAGTDTENHGSDAQGLLARGGYAVNGAVYASLAVTAARMALGSDNSASGDQSAQDWTARLLAQPFGPWLVGAAGLVMIGLGLFQLYRAYSADFQRKLKRMEMSTAEDRWITRLGRVGFAARGLVFGLVGTFLIVAAVQTNPEEARGLAGALATLAAQPYGPWLLALVAVGLFAYGLFMLIQARYRRMLIR